MIQKKTWLTALTLALALPLGAEASVYGVMNQVGVSGNVQGATNRYGNTNGGLGLRASLYNGGLFGTAKYRHEFGATYQVTPVAIPTPLGSSSAIFSTPAISWLSGLMSAMSITALHSPMPIMTLTLR